jgi:hypothetical protein
MKYKVKRDDRRKKTVRKLVAAEMADGIYEAPAVRPGMRPHHFASVLNASVIAPMPIADTLPRRSVG